ncbi:hypothetical protein FDA94_11125 [Herbidospora galbida]|uniref:Uncharacterized protein n=1 Tax=Herbidospora galbida TaxID=2575442 RepID=A0A4U3MHV6_9ACTN|nr:hypothetical protein [Herbidospora galbida]TKK89058.1 hypothetical protein FDA94_11125 [Herbidospora galbida]
MTAQYGQNYGQQPHPYYGAPQSPYGAPPPQGPVRPRILWIVLAWLLFIVMSVAGVFAFAGGLFSSIADVAPTTTFSSGETVKVNLDPAQKPAIWAAADQPTDVQCQVTGGSADDKITLTKGIGEQTVTVDGTRWELLFSVGVPAAGEYQASCDGEGVRFGVGKELISAAGGLVGGTALLLGLPSLGFLIAVLTTIVVLVRRSRARRRMMGMY